jgi:hypothetical protein
VPAAGFSWTDHHKAPGCSIALVDRFAQHCHKVDIDADSWRDAHKSERDGKSLKKPRRKAVGRRLSRQVAVIFLSTSSAIWRGVRLALVP